MALGPAELQSLGFLETQGLFRREFSKTDGNGEELTGASN
jgi:hypothetical protein